MNCQIECQIECQTDCQIECQVECQDICRIECQNICQIGCQNILNMSKYTSWHVMVGITRSRVFFSATYSWVSPSGMVSILRFQAMDHPVQNRSNSQTKLLNLQTLRVRWFSQNKGSTTCIAYKDESGIIKGSSWNHVDWDGEYHGISWFNYQHWELIGKELGILTKQITPCCFTMWGPHGPPTIATGNLVSINRFVIVYCTVNAGYIYSSMDELTPSYINMYRDFHTNQTITFHSFMMS